jgi:hypothetical protein
MTGMEKRWSVRKSVEMSVDLAFRNHTYLGCKSIDVGLGGMFLKFQRRKFPKHSEVDLVVRVQDEEGNRRGYVFKAEVVRSTDEGIGLSFKEFQVRDFRMLQNIMQSGSPFVSQGIALH